MKKIFSLILFFPLLALGQTAPPNYLALYSVPFNYSQSMSGKPVFVVSAPLSTGSTADPFPVVWDVAIGGGYAPVSGIVEMGNINPNWRKQGMMRLDISQNPPDLYWLDGNRTTWRNFSEVIKKYTLGGSSQQLQDHRFIDGLNHGITWFNMPWFLVDAQQEVTLSSHNMMKFATPNVYNLSAQVGWVPTLSNPADGQWDWAPPTGGGGGGGVGNTIYNANGTVLGDRTVNGGGHTLTFDNISFMSLSGTTDFKIRTPGVIAGSGVIGNVLKLSAIDGSVEFSAPTGGGGAGNTIYTADDGLTGNRTVNLGGFRLNFIGGSGSANFVVDTPGNVSLKGAAVSLKTPGVQASTKTVGMVPKLINTIGDVEFAAESSSITTGSGALAAGVYTIASPSPAYTSTSVYPDFFAVDMKPGTISAGGESLKVGSGPSKPIKSSNLSAIFAGDLTANSVSRLTFSVASDAFILNNPASTLAFDPATLSTTTAGGVTTVAVIGGGATTLYSGNGTISSTRTVTLGADLNFDAGTHAFNVIGSGAGNTYINTPVTTIESPTAVFIKTPEVLSAGIPAKTGQVLTLQSDGKSEFKPAPAPADGTITAAKLSFTKTNSIMASQGPTFAPVETKLEPLWVIKRGMLQRNYANIMFEVNAWGATSTSADTAAWQIGGTGTTAGLGGLSGHAGINTMNTLVGTNTYLSLSYRNDMIDFEAGNKLYFFGRVRVPTAPATSPGEAFRFRMGFGNVTTSAVDDSNCIAIGISADEVGESNVPTYWVLDTGAATAHTITLGNVGSGTAFAANTWFEFECEATTTAVTWWINGVQQPVATANIPSVANKFGPMIRLTSYNGGGAATKIVHVDAYNSWGVYAY